MPRKQKSRSNDSAQLSVRCDADLKSAYKDALDAREKSMSEDLREHMERVVTEHGTKPESDGPLPADDELARAYVTLLELVDPDRRQVDVEVAKSALADTLNRPKRTVRTAVLEPLERREYVVAKWGTLRVEPQKKVA